MSDPIVGIDLGTSNSVVAHADAAGAVKVLADDSGYKVHPSVVSFHPNGGVVVGVSAKQRKVIDPQNTIYSVKRLIGRSFRSPEVQTAQARSPFQIKEGANQAPVIVTRGGEFAVPEISAIVLDHVRNIASSRLDAAVNRAVVTVPASFNDAQRSATATAGAIAGLTVVRVLNEPTAAALAYGHTRNLREIIAVYDFGGGTFDITLLKLDDQVYEVLGTSGNTFLGGDDLDERLVDKMVAKFLTEERIDLRSNEVSMMRLRAVAEQTKIELSRRSRAVVRIDEIAYGARGAPLNLKIEIHRDEFVKDIADIVDQTFPVCSEALALAGLTIEQVSDVILVGGTSKIPYVRDQVSRFFAKAPRTDVNPEEAVATGAALQATALERILARKPSLRTGQPRPTGADADAAAGDLLELADAVSGATMPTSELTGATHERSKRPTARYQDSTRRPDTSYSVTRAGVRDAVEDPDRYAHLASRAALADTSPSPTVQVVAPPATEPPQSFETRTPPKPLGRMAPPPSKTGFGVPAGSSAFDAQLDGSTSGEAAFARPGTAGAAAPPPIPRPPLRQGPIARPPGPPQMTAQLPALNRPPELRQPTPPPAVPASRSVEPPRSLSSFDTAEVPERRSPEDEDDWREREALSWTSESDVPTSEDWSLGPATSPPLAPAAPLALPTEPTLVAVPPGPATARGHDAPTVIPEPSSSTARGLQSPSSFPAQPSQPIQRLPLATPAIPPPFSAAPRPAPPPPAAHSVPLPLQPLPLQPLPPPPAHSVPLPLQPPAPRPAPVLIEVTPRGLGIATVAGFCEALIQRNARVPAEIKKLFTTSRDQQEQVRIVVCQGESRRLDKNTVIGDLVLQNLPRRPRGETSIEVTFSLDASGILRVRARDAQTGVEQRADLDLVGGVAQDDIATSRDRLQQLRR